MWVTKLLISPVKKRIFCPKTTKFGPKLAFLINLGQAMQVYSVPCWWVGWWLWRAGCISQDTYLFYNNENFYCDIGHKSNQLPILQRPNPKTKERLKGQKDFREPHSTLPCVTKFALFELKLKLKIFCKKIKKRPLDMLTVRAES